MVVVSHGITLFIYFNYISMFYLMANLCMAHCQTSVVCNGRLSTHYVTTENTHWTLLLKFCFSICFRILYYYTVMQIKLVVVVVFINLLVVCLYCPSCMIRVRPSLFVRCESFKLNAFNKPKEDWITSDIFLVWGDGETCFLNCLRRNLIKLCDKGRNSL